MQSSVRSSGREVELPSAMWKGFSNTPQPKPDRGPGPVVHHGTPLNRLSISGTGGRVDEMVKPTAKPTPHFSNPQHLTISLGLDEQRLRQYIREQETLESGQGELDLK